MLYDTTFVWPPHPTLLYIFFKKSCIMLHEMLHSSGHLVVSCCMKFDRDQTFSLNKCCTIQHSFGHPIQLCCIYFLRNVVPCCAKCCTRLATLLYRVVSCCMKFDRDQTFSLNKCCTIQLFCFPGCCMMFYSFGHPKLCCTLLYIFLKKCCFMLYEMLHSFGHLVVSCCILLYEV